jgi:hypothetical protein
MNNSLTEFISDIPIYSLEWFYFFKKLFKKNSHKFIENYFLFFHFDLIFFYKK